MFKAITMISIHAPVKGATINCLKKYFPDLPISIHAPVKGATQTLTALEKLVGKFQSTHP